MDCKFFWTDEAIANLEEILDYLNEEWSEKEIEKFKNKLSRQLNIIQRFPKMFPTSRQFGNLRKAGLSKQTTIYYELQGNTIFLISIFINDRDLSRLIQDK